MGMDSLAICYTLVISIRTRRRGTWPSQEVHKGFEVYLALLTRLEEKASLSSVHSSVKCYALIPKHWRGAKYHAGLYQVLLPG